MKVYFGYPHVNMIALINDMKEICENVVVEYGAECDYYQLVVLCYDSVVDSFNSEFYDELMESGYLTEEGVEYLNTFNVTGLNADTQLEIFSYISATIRNMIK